MMYYFTEIEAKQVKTDLEKYLGKKMKYSPDKEDSLITDIQVQPTLHEIAVQGNIEYGYLVIVFFEKHPGLVPALFCSFNDITPPIFAGHEELNEGQKNQLVTNKFIEGHWVYKKGEDFLDVLIGNRETIIKGRINGQTEKASFSSDGHWFSYYSFMFMDDPYYIVFSANATEMSFGKIETPRTIDGKYTWQCKLLRT